MSEATLYALSAAFILGLFSNLHCIGMCGGLVLGLKLPLKLTPFCHVGRILSYTGMGVVFGMGVSWVFSFKATVQLGHLLRLLSGLWLVLAGLYVSRLWNGVSHIERLGQKIWVKLSPCFHRLLPVNTPSKAFCWGIVWGWLPCGLVYTALLWSGMAETFWEGGARMFAFGLGTWPLLFVLHFSSARQNAFWQRGLVRVAGGGLVIAMGVVSLWIPIMECL